VEKGEIADVFNQLIRVDKPLPAEIINLTGITDDMLAEGGDKTEVLQALLAFVRDLPLIAHNAEFDIPFLNHHLGLALGTTLANQNICTLKLARRIVPGLPSYRLQKLTGPRGPSRSRGCGDNLQPVAETGRPAGKAGDHDAGQTKR
jgi:DNA polymerase III alpha subunit (gram-positive type)